jgi:hypothetical protein
MRVARGNVASRYNSSPLAGLARSKRQSTITSRIARRAAPGRRIDEGLARTSRSEVTVATSTVQLTGEGTILHPSRR